MIAHLTVMLRVLLMACVLGSIVGNTAYAQGNTHATTALNQAIADGKQCIKNSPIAGISDSEWRQKYSARAVYCMKENLKEATLGVLKATTEYMKPVFAAVVIFAIIVFAMKLMTGASASENMRGEGFAFVIKLGMVAFLIQEAQVTRMVDIFFGMADEIMVMLSSGTNSIFMTSSFCPPANMSGLESWYRVWDKFDCIFGKIAGFGTLNNAATGLAAIFGAALFTGAAGVLLFLTGISMVVAFVMFLFRCILTMIFAYGAIGILIVVFPIFLPLVFFKATENYIFSGWLKLMIAKLFEPALIIFFLMFGLTIVEPLVYNGSNSTYINYDPNTNTTRISSTPGAGYHQAIPPLFDPLGVDLNAPANVREAQLQKNLKTDQKLFTMEVPNDPRYFAYMKNYCGTLGEKLLTGTGIVTGILNTGVGFVKSFIDPEEGKKQIQNGLTKALGSAGKLGVNLLMCNYGKSGGTWVGNTMNNVTNSMIDAGMPSVTMLDLSWHNKNNGSVPQGTTMQDIHEQRMMQLIAALAALFILINAFLTYINQTGRMAANLGGAKAQAAKISGFQVFGTTPEQAFKGGVKVAANFAINNKVTQKWNLPNGVKQGAKRIFSRRRRSTS